MKVKSLGLEASDFRFYKVNCVRIKFSDTQSINVKFYADPLLTKRVTVIGSKSNVCKTEMFKSSCKQYLNLSISVPYHDDNSASKASSPHEESTFKMRAL